MKILNTYHVSYPDLDGLGASFLTVLVQGDVGEFRVYSALVHLPDASSEEYEAARQQVARRGTLERHDRAMTFWPFLRREGYRS